VINGKQIWLNHIEREVSMKYFLGILPAILMGCSVFPIEQTFIAPEYINGTVVALVDEFYEHCPTANKVAFVALVPRPPSNASPTSNAYCTLKSTSGQGVVYMDSEAFFAKTDNQRRWTVAHELLHCSFNVSHDAGPVMRHDALSDTEADQVTWADVEKYCK
jgi:hypothetical protein